MPKKRTHNNIPIPCIDILLLIVGTRGDVQPFIALGQVLLAAGHRVRLATHETFRKFVRQNGLEFFPLAGDPTELMSFMVKNAGIIPSISSIVAGDLTKSRSLLTEILASTWTACIAKDDETNEPFTAEAIIANPPSFGHIHCAQKLQIPLHIMFTMPWSPTKAFPHPLVNVDYSRAAIEKVNMLSYSAIEMFTWSSLRDIVNNFRKETLGLPALHTRQATYIMIDERVPYTYCWSPALVPKPNDWASHINVSGFFFLEHDATADHTKESDDLIEFLGIGNNHSDELLPPVIYIGFGSIIGHDSDRILHVVLEALQKTGYRALLCGLAKDDTELPKNVLTIGNVPHDWLLQHVSAVCHHGGAGTTAAGLRAGKPTIIVPFFGDQFFWGNVIEKNGVGPRPIPGKDITAIELAEAFKFAHQPHVRATAECIRDAILKENGCEEALQAFHAHLPLSRMQSDLESTYVACYRLLKPNIKISRRVAQVLVISGRIEPTELHLHSTRYWPSTFDNRIHIPFHGILKHTHKAVVKIFNSTIAGVKQGICSDKWTSCICYIIVGLLLSLINGIGHLCIGIISLYGEITDLLDAAPSYYDPYSERSIHSRPYIIDFDTGLETALLCLFYGWKDGLMDLINTPRIGYERNGQIGYIVGWLLGIINLLSKPFIGSLASLTWLCRGIYADINHETLMDKGLEASTINTLGLDAYSNIFNEEQKQQCLKDINEAVKIASTITDYSTYTCLKIINNFDNIKNPQIVYHSYDHKSQ